VVVRDLSDFIASLGDETPPGVAEEVDKFGL